MGEQTVRRFVINVVLLAAFVGLYFILKQTGAMGQHVPVRIAFGLAVGVVAFVRWWRQEGDFVVSLIFLLLGILQFPLRRANFDTAAFLFIGIGLKEAYMRLQGAHTTSPEALVPNSD